MDSLKQLKEATTFIQQQIKGSPSIGLILGSGLGSLAEEITGAVHIPFSDIPYMEAATAEGHKGQLVIGELSGKQVIALQGRLHYYEGHQMNQVVFPVRIMAELGIKTMIISNACGGLNPAFKAGSLMRIKDHINFMGTNPLIGPNYEHLGPRFPDMSNAYDDYLGEVAQEVAQKVGIELHSGIYTAVTGPYYFSDAEHEMVRKFGADAIGMSTVPEVIVAKHAGMQILGISCVTDVVDPEREEPLTHEEVLEVAANIRPKFAALVKGVLGKL